MSEFSNNLIKPQSPQAMTGTYTVCGDSTNLDAHYSKNMKVKRPTVDNSKTPIIPNPKLYSAKDTNQRYQKLNEDVYTIYNSQDANKKYRKLNQDIFTNYLKEDTNNEFNFKTYFKIFCAIILTAGFFACLRYFKRK